MTSVPGRLFFRDDEVFTEWFRREGDGIVMRAEALDANGTVMSVVLEPYTKNEDVTGPGSRIDVTGSWDLTISAGSGYKGKIQENIKLSSSTTGMKELVRYRIYTTGGSAASDWISVRIFPPVFFDASS